MNTKVFLGLAIRIIIVFGVAMLMTFAPTELRDFFGDTLHDHSTHGTYHQNDFLDDGWEWGARHYWYWWMCFLLFVLSAINALIGGYDLVIKKYPNI